MAAETLATVDGIEEGAYTRHVIETVYGWSPGTVQLVAVTDSRSLEAAAHSSGLITDRKMRIDLAVLREGIAREEYHVMWKGGKDMMADALTKKGVNTENLVRLVRSGRMPYSVSMDMDRL